MPEKDPLNYSWITYAWVLGVSMWAGVVSYIRKRQRIGRPISILQWIAGLAAECTTAAFVGLITFWACEAANVPPSVSAVCIAITAHMGSRALWMAERQFCKEILRRFRLVLLGDSKKEDGQV